MQTESTPNGGVPNWATVVSPFVTPEKTTPGIYRGGQPTDAGWAFLKQMGVTRVVKLNSEDEGGPGQSSDVPAEALGMEVVYKPISLIDQLIFRPSKADIAVAVNAIQPGTYIHCEHGQDRTGLVVGCYRVSRQGWTKENAWKEMLEHGFHPELLGLTLFWEWAV